MLTCDDQHGFGCDRGAIMKGEGDDHAKEADLNTVDYGDLLAVILRLYIGLFTAVYYHGLGGGCVFNYGAFTKGRRPEQVEGLLPRGFKMGFQDRFCTA